MNIFITLLRVPLIILSVISEQKCGCAKWRAKSNKYIFCTKARYHMGGHTASSGETWKRD